MLTLIQLGRNHLDDAIRSRLITRRPDSARNLVLGAGGHVTDGRVVDRVATVHATNQPDFWNAPFHQTIHELVHESISRDEENALVLVGLVRDRHVLCVGCG